MTNFLEIIGPLFFPLSFLSIISLALVIERIWFFARLPKISLDKNFIELKNLITKYQNKEKILRDEIISLRLLEIYEDYGFGIKIMRLTAVLAPMLGLLGTVLGMIDSFKIISVSNVQVSPQVIADGLWNAMATTAYGLIIAIPAMMFAFFFSRISEKRIGTMGKELNYLSLKISGIEND